MGVYIPNIEKPKDCSDCILADKHLNGLYEAKYYCRLEADSCPLIEIGDIQYKAFLEFNEKLMKKLEEHILYGERRADDQRASKTKSRPTRKTL